MRALLMIALGHLRLELKDRSNVFWMLVMPLAFIAIFGKFMGSSGPPPAPRLRVHDADQTHLSRTFVEALSKQELRVEEVTAAQADSLKKGQALLTVPLGFADSLSLGRRVTARFAPRRADEAGQDMETKIGIYLAVARVLGGLTEADSGAAADSLSSGARHDLDSAAFRRRLADALGRPDLIETRVSTAGRGKALPTGFAATAQSMLVLFLLINVSMSGAVTLAQERQSRVLSRLAAYPVTRSQIIAGKTLGLLGLATAEALIIIGFGGLIFHVWWGPNPFALLLLLLCLGLAAAALGIFMGGWLRTPEQAGAVGWLIPLFLGAIGGTWWPLEVTPPWMQVVGHLSPAAWAMQGMHGLIAFGQGGAAVIVPCLVLILYAVVLTWAGSRMLRLSE